VELCHEHSSLGDTKILNFKLLSKTARLDYQLLFQETSPRSFLGEAHGPERAAELESTRQQASLNFSYGSVSGVILVITGNPIKLKLACIEIIPSVRPQTQAQERKGRQ